MSDEELVLRCCRNDPKAQEELFKRFSAKMLGVCMRYAASRDEAEDALQEGFIKVFRKIESFRSQGSLEGWVKRIMINTSLDHFRKNKELRLNMDIESHDFAGSVAPSISGTLGARDLMKMISAMPPGFRAVFNLYAIEGYAHKEIGEMLGITESTSKSQYSRARAYLQRQLQTEKAI